MVVLLFIRDLILATLGQMASLFAGVFIFGLLIQFFSQFSYKSLVKSFGNKGVYLVAWLGTPVHELGHVLFCLIFRHEIAEVKFFKPDKTSGTMGYVYHKWDPKNPWHILGNFFIGIGPVILGCIVLFALFYFLIPGSSRLWDSMLVKGGDIDVSSAGSYFRVWEGSALALLKLIFTFENLSGWRFWVFLYLAICVSANIRLSWSDFKHTFRGLGCVILPFFLFNLVVLLIGARLFPLTAALMGIVFSVLTLALFMALLGFVIIYAISATYYRLRYKLILNPFRG